MRRKWHTSRWQTEPASHKFCFTDLVVIWKNKDVILWLHESRAGQYLWHCQQAIFTFILIHKFFHDVCYRTMPSDTVVNLSQWSCILFSVTFCKIFIDFFSSTRTIWRKMTPAKPSLLLPSNRKHQTNRGFLSYDTSIKPKVWQNLGLYIKIPLDCSIDLDIKIPTISIIT